MAHFVNIFKLNRDPSGLAKVLESNGFEQRVDELASYEGWQASFWFSVDGFPGEVRWLDQYSDLFEGRYETNRYAGVYIVGSPKISFALSYGAAHFDIRNFADPDFGIEMAKRIADKDDVRKKGLRSHGGKKRRELSSFKQETPLFVRSGESVDLLSARILDSHSNRYGHKGDFGTSMRLKIDGDRKQIVELCKSIVSDLNKKEKFELPTLTRVNKAESRMYDIQLKKYLQTRHTDVEFVFDGFEISGVDICSYSDTTFILKHPKNKPQKHRSITIKDLHQYRILNKIPQNEILDIKVKTDQSGYVGIKKRLDFLVPNKRVALINGHWMKFNDDYVEQLDKAVDQIDQLPTEKQFNVINETEPEFNKSPRVKAAGYANADTNFNLARVTNAPSIEACDLIKGKVLYAVKRGTPQKLSYVCDQAINVLEIMRNQADIANFKLPETYCLWMIFERKSNLSSVSQIKSIIFKQKLTLWAHRCHEMGVQPSIKISYDRATAKKKSSRKKSANQKRNLSNTKISNNYDQTSIILNQIFRGV